MLTDALDVGDPHRHKAEDWLRLLRVVGGPASDAVRLLPVPPDERDAASLWLARNQIAERDTIVGIHPGASMPAKRWPLERFMDVALVLSSRPGVSVIAFQDPEGYGSELSTVPGVTLARTTLRELVALIERCDLIVCNDSGPMHIAGGVGTPAVAVFGSGVARWFAPVGNGHELVSGDESAGLSGGIDSVDVESVLEAVDRVIAATRARDRSRTSTPQLSPT
jgi:ADP-heptose:LPS heptosyltransferase